MRISKRNSLETKRVDRLKFFPFVAAIDLTYFGHLGFTFLVRNTEAPFLKKTAYLLGYVVFTLLGMIIALVKSPALLFWRLMRIINIIPKQRTSTEPRIIKAPGARLIAIVDFLFRPVTVEFTFKPLISDWQSEYFEALNQGRTKKARWVSIHYRFAFACTFIMAMGLSKVFSLFKQLSK